jgi:hypothetical protein
VRRVALALEIVRAYIRVRRTQRGRSLPDTLARLRDTGAPPKPISAWTAARLGRAIVRVISPLPGDSRCLVRSLVLVRLLAARGADHRLVIGVTPGEDFLAHAWVEVNGVAVLDPGDFGRLAEL